MEEKEIYNLIERFESSSLTVLEMQSGDFSIRLEKGGQMLQIQPSARPLAQSPAAAQLASQAAAEEQAAAMTAASGYRQVKSPIVGVYYAAAGPQQEPFVTMGQKVTKGQVLCLVEAMKMMNELKSPVDGIIRAIRGINGELVEFDQVLFEVEPC